MGGGTVCRMYRAGGEAPVGNQNVRLDGGYSVEALTLYRQLRAFARIVREMIEEVE